MIPEQAPGDAFVKALTVLDRLSATRLFSRAAQNLSPLASVEELIVPALDRIGRDWEEGRLSLAQVYMSGRICEALVESLLSKGGFPPGLSPVWLWCFLKIITCSENAWLFQAFWQPDIRCRTSDEWKWMP